MKIRKAPGEDGLENEVWKYMPVSIGEEVWIMIGKIWKEGRIPDRELGKRNGKMFACFADMKGAFDKVDRDHGGKIGEFGNNRQRRRIKRDIETIQKMAEEKKGMEISTEKTKILVFEKRKKGEKLEVERRRTGKSEGNKILRIHIGKKWKCREALSRMKKKGNNSDEENMEHRGKDI
ncbi:hypothetical protein PV328_001071 [Microctonus aethiopoides]|uniref:Uncharacterized protein n=1 Tax=Microctonus aethiopoides TaxID=144406 RepID=A0AA39FWF0_9HYME|nr:hypothetical protein PV328_001071 [Microctonus aethiopoides]